MEEMLIRKLQAFLEHNHPDIIAGMTSGQSFPEYVRGKVAAVRPLWEQLRSQGKSDELIADECIQAMTQDLRPSRFLYVRDVMQEEFPVEFRSLFENGDLKGKLIEVVEACGELFTDYDFKSEPANRFLRYAVIVEMHKALN